ncbi:MAG: DUF2254 domain-containing protein, partial [Weeksellaceae bacterium]|nr:DUF2254 domain-containing protein [Weeksellaceae bacterium]
MNKFTYLYKRLNSTFWFKPLLIVMLGFVLSIFFLYLDTKTGYEPDGIFRMILSGSSESARSVLSAIASAMIGVAGTVFSITLVVLTLATNQFGSRLLRNFMYQNMNQIVLGSYAGTYLYCLIVLNAVKGQETFTFVPNISVLFSLVLAVVNLVLLIFFIHHVSVSIQSHNVIENIVQSFKKQSDTIYPEEIGFDFDTSSDLKQQLKAFTKTHVVSQKAGYLQYVDEDIYQYAIDHGFIIKVHHRPGHYIIANIPIATIYNVENEDVEEINKTVSDYLPMDRLDTDFQNPEFSIHQIVEVACRALSAGINDNYTVITCIDKLTYIL